MPACSPESMRSEREEFLVLKVAVFTLYYLPREGGAITRLNSQISGNSDVEFTIFAPRQQTEGLIVPEQGTEIPSNATLQRVPTVWRKGFAAATYALAGATLRLTERRPDFDAFHCISPPVTTALPARLLARSWKRVLIDVGDPWVEGMLIAGLIRGRRTAQTFRRLENSIIGKAGHVICRSPLIADMFREANPNLEVIFTSFDLDEVPVSVGERVTRLVYVGHLDVLHVLDPALMAMRELAPRVPELKLVIVGDGPHRGNLERIVEREGLEGRVEFAGSLPNIEVRRLVTSSALSVIPISDHPLHQYTVPAKLLESLAAGTPVIGWGSRGVKLVIEESGSGVYLDDFTPDRIAAEIERLIADGEERDRLSANARAFASEKLDRAKSQARINDIYRRLGEARP